MVGSPGGHNLQGLVSDPTEEHGRCNLCLFRISQTIVVEEKHAWKLSDIFVDS